MGDIVGAIVVGTILLWLAVCVFIVPTIMYTSWLEKRDCQLISQQECVYVMTPVEATQ